MIGKVIWERQYFIIGRKDRLVNKVYVSDRLQSQMGLGFK